MVDCIVDPGWTVGATAERFQVDAKTVRKWRDRFVSEGDAGLLDRSCRPHRSPNRTPPSVRHRVVKLRRQRRWGAERIGFETGWPPRRCSRSCVRRVLVASTAATGPRARSPSRSAISVNGRAS
jgi:hypothetical protein